MGKRDSHYAIIGMAHDGGFFLCHWDGTAETEAKIKEETQATIRCVPFMFEQTPGIDMVSGKPATQRVIIARSY